MLIKINQLDPVNLKHDKSVRNTSIYSSEKNIFMRNMSSDLCGIKVHELNIVSSYNQIITYLLHWRYVYVYPSFWYGKKLNFLACTEPSVRIWVQTNKISLKLSLREITFVFAKIHTEGSVHCTVCRLNLSVQICLVKLVCFWDKKKWQFSFNQLNLLSQLQDINKIVNRAV